MLSLDTFQIDTFSSDKSLYNKDDILHKSNAQPIKNVMNELNGELMDVKKSPLIDISILTKKNEHYNFSKET